MKYSYRRPIYVHNVQLGDECCAYRVSGGNVRWDKGDGVVLGCYLYDCNKISYSGAFAIYYRETVAYFVGLRSGLVIRILYGFQEKTYSKNV